LLVFSKLAVNVYGDEGWQPIISSSKAYYDL
jgi:hypothetical protein